MCGIFGWIGNKPKDFDSIKFNILGNYNDTRGGDSCGIYYNRNTIKGINSESKYRDLVFNYELHNHIKLEQPIIIGHTRKASVGEVSVTNIQPVIIYENDDETSNPLIIQAHNGTITNIEELAEKYKIPIAKKESDSIILAKIILNHGFEVLKEYEGSAALLIHLPGDDNVMYAFHGKSKSWYTSPSSEERPLFYIHLPGKGIYISSMDESLKFISTSKHITPISFDHNYLYKITGEKVERLDLYDREKLTKKNTSDLHFIPYTSSGNSHCSGRNHDYYDDNYYNRNYSNSKTVSENINRVGLLSVLNDNPAVATERCVRYNRGFYMYRGNMAHGKFILDNLGYVLDKSSPGRKYTLYFYYGILIGNKKGFKEIEKKCEEKGIITPSIFYSQDNFRMLNDIIERNSVFPFTRYDENSMTGWMKETYFFKAYTNSFVYYDGLFTPMLCTKVLSFRQGSLKEVRDNYSFMTISMYLDTLDKILNEVVITAKKKLSFYYSESHEPKDTKIYFESDDEFDDKYKETEIDCPKCKGTGYINVQLASGNGKYTKVCQHCEGTGFISTSFEEMGEYENVAILRTEISKKLDNVYKSLREIPDEISTLGMDDDFKKELDDFEEALSILSGISEKLK